MIKRFVVVAMLCLFSTAVANADSTLFGNNPALDKPVTLAVKGESLADIANMLTEKTGAKLKIAKDIADQKATIFVDQKPLKDVMLGIETCFRYKWFVKEFKGEATYELTETERVRQERLEYTDKAIKEIRKQVGDKLAEMASKFPSDKGLEDIRNLREAERQLIGNGLRSDDPDYAEKQKEWLSIHEKINAHDNTVIAAQILSFSPQAMEGFWSGLAICHDSLSAEPGWNVSSKVSKALFALAGRHFQITPEEERQGARATIRITPKYSWYPEGGTVTALIRGEEIVSKSRNSSWGSWRHIHLPPIIVTLGAMPEMPDYLPHKTDDDMFSKEIEYDLQELVDEAGISENSAVKPYIWINRADYLALLHRKTGVQIIADYYSAWKSNNIKGKRCLTVRGYIADMSRIWDKRITDYTGWDGKFLYVRAKDSYALNAREVPNSILRPLQKSCAKKGYLGWDDLGRIAQLTGDQIMGLDQEVNYLGLGDSKTHCISSRLNIYRFVATLSSEKRKKLLSGGIKASELTPEQKLLAVGDSALNMSYGKGPIAGIYKDGIRIDKPNFTDYTGLVSIELKPLIPVTKESPSLKTEPKVIQYEILPKFEDGGTSSGDLIYGPRDWEH